jgi:hypothetical protein
MITSNLVDDDGIGRVVLASAVANQGLNVKNAQLVIDSGIDQYEHKGKLYIGSCTPRTSFQRKCQMKWRVGRDSNAVEGWHQVGSRGVHSWCGCCAWFVFA